MSYCYYVRFLLLLERHLLLEAMHLLLVTYCFKDDRSPRILSESTFLLVERETNLLHFSNTVRSFRLRGWNHRRLPGHDPSDH